MLSLTGLVLLGASNSAVVLCLMLRFTDHWVTWPPLKACLNTFTLTERMKRLPFIEMIREVSVVSSRGAPVMHLNLRGVGEGLLLVTPEGHSYRCNSSTLILPIGTYGSSMLISFTSEGCGVCSCVHHTWNGRERGMDLHVYRGLC